IMMDAHFFALDLASTARQVWITISSIEDFQGEAFNDVVYASTARNVFNPEGATGTDTFIFRSLAEVGLGATADFVNARTDKSIIDLSRIDA
ncbi:hypothetical protein AAHH80_33140, partial [Burkholderia pseudomallei]